MLERATSHDNPNYIYCDAVGRSDYRCGDRTMKDILGKIIQLTAHNGDVKSNLERVLEDQFAGVPDVSCLFVPKKKQLIEDFTTTVQDIEICVMGDYTKDEPDCNYRGGYSITKLWIPTDTAANDIQAWFAGDILERISCEGDVIMAERAREAKADYREYERGER